MRRRRRTPRRRLAPRWTVEEWEPVTLVLLARDHGCPRCNLPLREEMERHHRQRREVGGDRYAQLLGLHPECHSWVHAHPEEARRNGWIVSAYDDPLTTPVLMAGRWWRLDDDGKRHPASPPDVTDPAAP